MKFWERWQTGLAAYGDAAQSGLDLVGSFFDEDDHTVGDYMYLLGRAGKGVAYGSGNMLMGNVGAVVEPVAAAAEPVGAAVNQLPSTYQSAVNLANSPTWQARQGYVNQPGFMGEDTRPTQAMLDPETWSEAWEMAKSTSVGEAGWRGMWKRDGRQIDIMDKDAVQKLQDDPWFNAASGLTDAAYSWYVDPLALGGKVIAAGKKVSNVYQAGSREADPWLEKQLFKHTRLGEKELDPYKLAHSDKIDEFLAWASGKSARDILRHPMIQNSSRKDDFAGVIAGLLDRQDAGTARLAIASAFGSKKAYQLIEAKDADLAQRIANVREMSNNLLDDELLSRKRFGGFLGFQDQKIEQKINALNPASDKYHDRLRTLLVQHDQNQKNIYNATLGEYDGASGLLYSAVKQVPKSSQARIADRHIAYETGDFKEYLNSSGAPQAVQTIIQSRAFGTPIRMISYFPFKAAQGFTNKIPPSWIDPNRADSSAGLVSYMKHAKVFDETRMGQLTNEYINALDITGRRRVVQQAEAEAVVAIAKKHGLDDTYANILARVALSKRNDVIAQLKGQMSGGKTYFLDPDGNEMRWALFETQQINNFPLLNLEDFNRSMGKHAGGLKAALWYSPTAFVSQAYDAFNGIWSAAQLLRIGYGMRNITDAALRLAATMGASSFALEANHAFKAGIGAGVATRLSNMDTRIGAFANMAIDVPTMLGNKAIAKAGGTPTHPNLTTFGDLRDRALSRMDQMGRDLDTVRTQSHLSISYRGESYKSPYYGKAEPYEVLASSSYQNIAETRDSLLKGLRGSFGSEQIINPTDRGHLEAWAHIAKNVIGKSELAKQFFMGKTYNEVLHWLTRDPKGQNVLRKVGGKGIEARAIVGEAMAVVDTYVPLVAGSDPGLLRGLAYRGKLTAKDLEMAFPNVNARPQLWNPQIALNLRDTGASRILDEITSRGFKLVAQMPEDKLIRNPAFRAMLIGNIRMLHHNLESQIGQGHFTNLDLERISHQAREMSLQQLKRTLYDGDTKSNIAHRFRMLMGFMPAWEDSIMKWGRIVVDNPSVLVQGSKLWNAPNEMDLGSTWDPDYINPETGMQGRYVPRLQVVVEKKDENGNGTGEWVEAPRNNDIFSMNEDAFIEVRMPTWFTEMLKSKWFPGEPQSDTWRVSKGSMNLALQGDAWWLPSAGPLTQFAVSKIALANPILLGDVRKWAIPYGPEDNVVKAVLPAWIRRMYESGESVSDDSYATAFMGIAQTMIRKARLGKTNLPPKEEFFKQIKARTDTFYKLRSYVNFMAPFSAQNVSPYQFYIDQYRMLKSKYAGKVDNDGKPFDVDGMFLTNYGDDFYMFTMSLSKNNTGLPASKRAWELSEKNRDLIAKDPEMAAIYLSDVDSANFDQYVYAAQFKQKFSDASDMTAREHRNPMDAIDENQRNLGWKKYVAIMDYVTGLEKEPDADLDYLKFFRSYVGKQIALENPQFAEDYLKSDPEKIPSRIQKMQQLVMDKSIQSRPEIRTLTTYLIEREKFLSELDRRDAEGGAKTLAGKDNRDLREAWEAKQLELAESNTLFGRIYWRYLRTDMLQRSRLELPGRGEE